MALDMPLSFAPPVPDRVAEITSRFDPSSGPPTTGTVSSDFASLLSDQLAAQTTSASLSALAGGDDTTDPTDQSAATGGSSWMSALSSLLNEMGGAPGTTDGPSGSDVVADATQYLGVPYKWGGTNPATGLDCSGFVQHTYADLGVQLPRTAAAQATTGTAVDSLANAQPGDLVAFGQPVDHIGIYVGNGKMIEAPHTGDVVKIANITKPVTAIRHIVGSTGTSSLTSTLSGLLGSGSSSSSALWASALSSGSTSPTSSTGSISSGAAPYQALFNAAGAKYGIDPAVLSSVAKAESGYNPSAVSSSGAVGLMQFMPSTAAGMGFDPTDPAQAIDGAARYLSTQVKNFGSLPLALAAYNAGPNAVKRYGGIPPYPETQNYVAKVLASVGQARAA